jgi:hypothetical protein
MHVLNQEAAAANPFNQPLVAVQAGAAAVAAGTAVTAANSLIERCALSQTQESFLLCKLYVQDHCGYVTPVIAKSTPHSVTGPTIVSRSSTADGIGTLAS